MDQSELAFRMLCRRHGADLCYTPMLHSRLFVESEEYRLKMFEKHALDRPLVVQVGYQRSQSRLYIIGGLTVLIIAKFCGNDPETVLKAAKHVEAHCDAVDLNLGCPQVGR